MVSYRHWSVLLWWDPNDVPHRRIMPSYEAEWWSVPAPLCWWCCYCLADQLWVLIAYARRRMDSRTKCSRPRPDQLKAKTIEFCPRVVFEFEASPRGHHPWRQWYFSFEIHFNFKAKVQVKVRQGGRVYSFRKFALLSTKHGTKSFTRRTRAQAD